MKKQKAKRLLSLILAMMLVVGMIPISALAAGTSTLPDYDATANDAIVITASVSPNFGYKYTNVTVFGGTEMPEEKTISGAAEYNGMVPYMTNPMTAGDKRILDVIKDTTKTDVEKAKTIASCVSEAFKGSESATVSSSTAATTNYVYVGVKATMNNKTAATYGIKQYALALEYDSSLLEPANTSGSVVNKALGFNESPSSSFHYDGDYLAGTYTLTVGNPEAAANIAGEGRANLKMVTVTLEPGGNCKFPIPLKTDLEGEGATSWDIVIPFKVLPDASTDENGTKISVVAGNDSKTPTFGEVLSEDYKTKTNIDGTRAQQILLTSDDTKTRLSGNSVTVNIQGVPKPLGLATQAITYSTAGVPIIHFDCSSDNAAIGKIKYKIEGGESWSALGTTGGSGADTTWEVPAAVVTALCEGKYVEITSNSADTTVENTTKKISVSAEDNPDITVVRVDAPAATLSTVATVHYGNETVQAKTNYEVKKTDGTYVATGTDVVFTDAGVTASNNKITVRAAGNSNGMPSTDVEVALATGATLVADNTTDWSVKVQGKTTLKAGTASTGEQALKDGDKVVVTDNDGNGDPTAPTDWTTNVKTVSSLTSGFAVEATEGQTIWFKSAADANNPAASGSIAGVGFGAPTIEMEAPTTDTGAVVLKIKNSKGQFASASVATVKDKSNNVVNTYDTALDTLDNTVDGSSQTKLTLTPKTGDANKWVKGDTYTVEIATSGTTPNLSTGYTGTFNVADKAYKLPNSATVTTPSANLTLTPNPASVTAASGTSEVTVAGIPAGYELDQVTLKNGANACGTAKVDDTDKTKFTWTAPNEAPQSPITLTAEITLKAKTYTITYPANNSFGADADVSVSPSAALDSDIATANDLAITKVMKGGTDTTSADKAKFSIVANTGKITASKNTLDANSTYTLTVASASLPNCTADVTIKIGTKTAIPVIPAKDYDGTNTITGSVTWNDADNKAINPQPDLTLTGAVYGSVNAGTADIDFSNATLGGGDASAYTLTTAYNGTNVQGTINQIAMTAPAAITVAGTAATSDAAATLIGDTALTDGAGISLGKVSDNVAAGAIKTAVEDALKTAGYVTSANTSYDASQTATDTTTTTVKIGDTITPTGAPSGATYALKAAVAGVSIDPTTGVVTIGTGATATLSFTVVVTDPADSSTTETTFSIGTVNPAEVDITKAYGQELTVTVPFDVATNNSALAGNYSGGTSGSLTVKFTPSGSSSRPPIYTGPTVTVDDQSYGSANATTVEVDENGKIVSLPEVTNVVKGAEFIGWSTNGTVAGIIDPETFVVKEGEELTLTAVYRGYISGYEDHTAKPNQKITRAELARMLAVAMGGYDPDEDYTSDFTDLNKTWAGNEIAYLQTKGVVFGDKGTGKFRPNDQISREEAASMIARAFGVNIPENGTTDKITDFGSVSSWAANVVAALCNNGTISGYEDKTFRPSTNFSRAECAVMVNKYLGLNDTKKDTIKSDSTMVSPFGDVKKTDWYGADMLFASLSVPANYYSTTITQPTAE